MQYKIENEQLTVISKTYGAELISVKDNAEGKEYYAAGTETGLPMVLFPNAAKLKDNTLIADGRKYEIEGAGFARTSEFSLCEAGNDYAVYELQNTPETEKCYPYAFSLKIRYELEGRTLHVISTVKNSAEKPMYFELGFHPAYRCDNSAEEHALVFEEPCTAGRFIRPNLLTEKIVPKYLDGVKVIPVTEDLFKEGTIALQQPTSKKVSIVGRTTGTTITVDGSAFPNIPVYAPYGKPMRFLSIELWSSDPEYADTDQIWEHKKGVLELGAGQTYENRWAVTFA
ncbi:MAG: hypothetical protein E7240_08990 [Lachnospiraceae bacterium]|nr:hypothetical protein [Lachnospiraceae bacterium]